MNVVIETFQFLVETLLIIMLHWMVDIIKDDLDPPSAPLVVPARFLVGAVGEAEGDANHPSWKVGVGS